MGELDVGGHECVCERVKPAPLAREREGSGGVGGGGLRKSSKRARRREDITEPASKKADGHMLRVKVRSFVCVFGAAQEEDEFRVNPGTQHQGSRGRRLVNDLSAGAWEPGEDESAEREKRQEGRDPGDPSCCEVAGGGSVLVTAASLKHCSQTDVHMVRRK